jgi:hypothetical protein
MHITLYIAPEERNRRALNRDPMNNGTGKPDHLENNLDEGRSIQSTQGDVISPSTPHAQEEPQPQLESDNCDPLSSSPLPVPIPNPDTATPPTQQPPLALNLSISTPKPSLAPAVQSVPIPNPDTATPPTQQPPLNLPLSTPKPSLAPAVQSVPNLNPDSDMATPPIQQLSLPLSTPKPSFVPDIQSDPILNPDSDTATPPIQQLSSSLPLSTPNIAAATALIQQPPPSLSLPLLSNLSTPNPAVVTDPIQLPLNMPLSLYGSLALPDAQPVSTASVNPAPVRTSVHQLTSDSQAATLLLPTTSNMQLLSNLPAPLEANSGFQSIPTQTSFGTTQYFMQQAAGSTPTITTTYLQRQPFPQPTPSTDHAHQPPFNFPATGWAGSVPSPATGLNFSQPWELSGANSENFYRTDWNDISENFPFSNYLNMGMVDDFDLPGTYLPAGVPNDAAQSMTRENTMDASTQQMTPKNTMDAPTQKMTLENTDAPNPPSPAKQSNEDIPKIPSTDNLKEKAGLDRASRSRRPASSKEVPTIWREAAYTYFCQELDCEEWKQCINMWLEFEKKEESGLDTNSVSIYPSLQHPKSLTL